MLNNKMIDEFKVTGAISDEIISALQYDSLAKQNLLGYFRQSADRGFAICLLSRLIECRKTGALDILIEHLMFAAYLVGLCGDIKDSAIIWQAKRVDFDAWCAFDAELVAFAGKYQTIKFLTSLNDDEFAKAIGYLKNYPNGHVEEYFVSIEDQWWLV